MNRQRLLCALCLLSLTAYAGAQESDDALELTADSVEYDIKSGISTYKGNVLIRQGRIQVRGSLIEVFRGEGAPSRVYVREGPGEVRWQIEEGRAIEGYADTLDYNAVERTLRLKGNARIKDHLREIKGDDITYDLNRQIMRADSPKGGRVRMVIQPDPQKERQKKQNTGRDARYQPPPEARDIAPLRRTARPSKPRERYRPTRKRDRE